MPKSTGTIEKGPQLPEVADLYTVKPGDELARAEAEDTWSWWYVTHTTHNLVSMTDGDQTQELRIRKKNGTPVMTNDEPVTWYVWAPICRLHNAFHDTKQQAVAHALLRRLADLKDQSLPKALTKRLLELSPELDVLLNQAESGRFWWLQRADEIFNRSKAFRNPSFGHNLLDSTSVGDLPRPYMQPAKLGPFRTDGPKDCAPVGPETFDADDCKLWRFTYEYNANAGWNNLQERTPIECIEVEPYTKTVIAYRPVGAGEAGQS